MKISVVSDGNLTYAESVAAIPGALSSSFANELNEATEALSFSGAEAYYDIFKEASATYGVDINLLMAMAKQESDFNPNAVSHSGAMGVMQLMPFTAEAMGVENPFDPYQNIMGGAKYIADKLAMYGGDVSLALAAYNAGSGAVAKYGGIPPYEETQNYVTKILGYMQSGIAVPAVEAEPQEVDKEQIAEKLEALLADFANHESFDEFVELFNQEIAASESVDGSTDAYDAYAQLGAANRAIQSMLQNKQENNV